MTLRLAAFAAPLLALAALASPATAGSPSAPLSGHTAEATSRSGDAAPVVELAQYYRGPAFCVAVAFRGNGRGPRIRGTRAAAEARFTRRACRRALRRCFRRLAYVPHGPYAQCLVVRSS